MQSCLNLTRPTDITMMQSVGGGGGGGWNCKQPLNSEFVLVSIYEMLITLYVGGRVKQLVLSLCLVCSYLLTHGRSATSF